MRHAHRARQLEGRRDVTNLGERESGSGWQQRGAPCCEKNLAAM
jgi:hypothetical protein